MSSTVLWTFSGQAPRCLQSVKEQFTCKPLNYCDWRLNSHAYQNVREAGGIISPFYPTSFFRSFFFHSLNSHQHVLMHVSIGWRLKSDWPTQSRVDIPISSDYYQINHYRQKHFQSEQISFISKDKVTALTDPSWDKNSPPLQQDIVVKDCPYCATVSVCVFYIDTGQLFLYEKKSALKDHS